MPMLPISTRQFHQTNSILTVQLTMKGRIVTVKGPRGSLTKDLRHLKVDLRLIAKNKKLRAEQWFGDRRSLACIRTCMTHIQNMITGVTKGFEYKMRTVYAHFPISVASGSKSNVVEIRNFLGEKVVRNVRIPDGVTFAPGGKDEIVFTGNDIKSVSQAGELVFQFFFLIAACFHEFDLHHLLS